MFDVRTAGAHFSVSGFTQVSMLADKQRGPTCGFEAIENIIQLFQGVGNNFSQQRLIPAARALGLVNDTHEGPILMSQGYRRILQEYGISSKWYPFNHLETVIPALKNNHGVLVVGDAHQLDPMTYRRPNAWHAYVLTNYYTDEWGNYALGYVGIDSNFPGQERCWPARQAHASALQTSQYLMQLPVLITDEQALWPRTSSHYRQLQDGRIFSFT